MTNLTTLPPGALPKPMEANSMLLASLPNCVRGSLKPTYDRDSNLTGYRVKGPLTLNDIDAAIEQIEAASKPLPRAEMVRLLYEVHAHVGPEGDHPEKVAAKIKRLGEVLERYPGDIVQHCLERWPLNSKWWPKTSELVAEIETLNDRGKILATLGRERAKMLRKAGRTV
jgi:hypothetical protein